VSEVVVTNDDWHRIALTWDGAHRRLYADGVLVAEDVQERLADSYGKMVIGADKNMRAGTYWTGRIDDVRIYTRAVTP
jgi:hypothetical protein